MTSTLGGCPGGIRRRRPSPARRRAPYTPSKRFAATRARDPARAYCESLVVAGGGSGAILEISRRIASISSSRPAAIMLRAMA